MSFNSIVEYGEVNLHIDNNILNKVSAQEGAVISELHIPHVLPTGHIIDKLGKKVFSELHLTQINRIIIDDEISVIEDSAFKDIHANVKELVWPAACKEIAPHCFENANIERVSGIGNVTYVGHSAFKSSYISEIEWPNGADDIPRECFEFCYNIHKITGLEGVKTVGVDAFFMCESLTEITFGNALNSIDAHAFSECTKLSSIILGNNLTEIGDQSFYHTALKSITVPDSVNYIGIYAFCKSDIKSFDWPESCRWIQENTFAGCSNLREISGYEHVIRIDFQAFHGCTALTEFTVPDGVKVIPPMCFSSSGLTLIKNIEHVTEIGQSAFARSALKSFSWPEECTSIKEGTFKLCADLTKIKGIEKVNEIGAQAFYGCTALTEFTVPDSVKEIPMQCFSNSGITAINNIEHLTRIGLAAFANSALKGRFRWPDCCLIVYANTFDGCSALEGVDNLDRVISIGSEAFQNTGISIMDLSHSVCCSVGENAFSGIDSVTLPYFISSEERMT